VKPGGRLSLQNINHRSEHLDSWVGGRRCGQRTHQRTARRTNPIYSPIGAVHRLKNPARFPAGRTDRGPDRQLSSRGRHGIASRTITKVLNAAAAKVDLELKLAAKNRYLAFSKLTKDRAAEDYCWCPAQTNAGASTICAMNQLRPSRGRPAHLQAYADRALSLPFKVRNGLRGRLTASERSVCDQPRKTASTTALRGVIEHFLYNLTFF